MHIEKEEVPHHGERNLQERSKHEEGNDITCSYGSTLNIVHEVVKEIKKLGIECELIDVQSLIPFDISKYN